MNKYGKKSVVLFWAGILATNIFAAPAAAENNALSEYQISIERDCSVPTDIDAEMLDTLDLSPLGKLRIFEKSISKTIKKTYADRSSIPAAVNYREYIDGAWYGGILSQTEIRYLSSCNLYEATFSGKLYLQ